MGNMMSYLKALLCGVIVLGMASGCARAARDTTSFALENAASVQAPMEDTWQAVKTVLRERDYEIYTRDKRGVFVAYTPTRRQLLQPRRVKYTVELTELSPNETRIFVESVNQIYGVTLLTYPGWHDRPTSDTAGAAEILNGVQARLAGSPLSVEAAEPAT
jgi:hypothetical protein